VTWLDECVVSPSDVFGLSPSRVARIRETLPIAEVAAEREGVPLDLLLGVMWVESRFNSRAGSSAGAQGLMQIMPKTFAYIASKTALPSRNVWDPETNITAGTWLLGALLRRYGGNVELALAAYNAGAGNVAKHGGVPPFTETRNYVKAVPRAARNFRIARTERCQGVSASALSWSSQGRGGGASSRRRRTAPRRRPTTPQAPPSDGGGLVMLAVAAGLAWGLM